LTRKTLAKINLEKKVEMTKKNVHVDCTVREAGKTKFLKKRVEEDTLKRDRLSVSGKEG